MTEFRAVPSALQKGRMTVSRLALTVFKVLMDLFLGSDKHGSQC